MERVGTLSNTTSLLSLLNKDTQNTVREIISQRTKVNNRWKYKNYKEEEEVRRRKRKKNNNKLGCDGFQTKKKKKKKKTLIYLVIEKVFPTNEDITTINSHNGFRDLISYAKRVTSHQSYYVFLLLTRKETEQQQQQQLPSEQYCKQLKKSITRTKTSGYTIKKKRPLSLLLPTKRSSETVPPRTCICLVRVCCAENVPRHVDRALWFCRRLAENSRARDIPRVRDTVLGRSTT